MLGYTLQSLRWKRKQEIGGKDSEEITYWCPLAPSMLKQMTKTAFLEHTKDKEMSKYMNHVYSVLRSTVLSSQKILWELNLLLQIKILKEENDVLIYNIFIYVFLKML